MNRSKPLFAILGPTATGKSALALALATRPPTSGPIALRPGSGRPELESRGGAFEIVNCDSTAVYRGFDIGTDKVPVAERQGIPHHLIDIVDPTAEYTAADYARDAARVIADIHQRGGVPILVGGTGFYFRALTRGLFPGPGKDAALRDRLSRMARRRGVAFLWRIVKRVDPASAERILPRDEKRLIRALEVYFQTGKPLTAHFADTVSLLGADVRVTAIGLRLDSARLGERLARRVDAQFAAGLVDEVRALLAAGVPETARPFGGLVYRQVLDYLHGVRDLDATRALIVRENKHYARRQLIWFRKEPNLTWFDGPGEAPAVQANVHAWLAARGL